MNFGLDWDRNLYLINIKEAKIQPNFWSGFFLGLAYLFAQLYQTNVVVELETEIGDINSGIEPK